MRIYLLIALAMCCAQVFAFSNAELKSKLVTATTAALQSQHPDGHWAGRLQSDPSWDVLRLVLGKRLNQPDIQLSGNLRARLENWKRGQSAWGPVPGGEPSVDITGAVLLGLRELGVAPTDPLVVPAWIWFRNHGGADSFSQMAKFLLYPLGLVDTHLPLTVSMFSFPKSNGVNIQNVGIIRLQLIPLLIYDYYFRARRAGLAVGRLSAERLKSKGSAFTDLNFALRDEDFWAQEGLGWLVSHQQSDGPWYILQSSILSLIALNEAQRSGVHDFSREITLGWQGLSRWMRTDPSSGEDFISPSLSEGWDTPQMTNTLLGLPEETRPADLLPQIERATQWMVNTQAMVEGDWAYLAPELRPGGWSFFHNNPLYPDTDVTAATLEALDLAKQNGIDVVGADEAFGRGLDWLLGMQNLDGSWGAWDRGVSHLFGVFASLLENINVIDTGQVDLTARLVKIMAHLRPSLAGLRESEVERAMHAGCRYVRDHAQIHPAPHWLGDWWVNSIYATGTVVDALMAAQCLSLTEAEPSVRWLLNRQNADGGWGESHRSYAVNDYVEGPSRVSQSAHAVLALISFERAYQAGHGVSSPRRYALEKGIGFLLSQVGPQGFRQENGFSGVMAKGYWYIDYEMAPQWWGLMALSEYLKFEPNGPVAQ